MARRSPGLPGGRSGSRGQSPSPPRPGGQLQDDGGHLSGVDLVPLRDEATVVGASGGAHLSGRRHGERPRRPAGPPRRGPLRLPCGRPSRRRRVRHRRRPARHGGRNPDGRTAFAAVAAVLCLLDLSLLVHASRKDTCRLPWGHLSTVRRSLRLARGRRGRHRVRSARRRGACRGRLAAVPHRPERHRRRRRLHGLPVAASHVRPRRHSSRSAFQSRLPRYGTMSSA